MLHEAMDELKQTISITTASIPIRLKDYLSVEQRT